MSKPEEPDPMPTPDEFKALVREWRDDASQRPLRDAGVRYEDHAGKDFDKILDDAARRGGNRTPSRGPER